VLSVRDVDVEFAVGYGGTCVAYEVFGSGPIDVLLPMGRFPIDLIWELPQLADFLDRLGEMARVVAYDVRGTGASDPLPTSDFAGSMEWNATDSLAVLDAAGSDRASVLSLAQDPEGLFLAAAHPERVRSVIASHVRTSYPEMRGYTLEQRRKMARSLSTPRALRADNPRVAHDPVLQRWWGRARRATSPEAIARQLEWAAETNTEALLGTVRTPTLVLHRRDNHFWDVETSRAAASLLPNARFVEVPGAELDLFLGDTTPVLVEIERFLVEPDVLAAEGRVLATVMFTDIVGSTDRLAELGDGKWRDLIEAHDRVTRRELERFRGREVGTRGDGFVATFDGPGRAIQCGRGIRDAVKALGIEVRVGLHTGEIELRDDDEVAGVGVHIAARVGQHAGPSEILVSSTVKDLVAGSGIEFDDRGEQVLKGVPEPWRLFAVVS
jgi:class 3 adenylate cyclase